MLGGYLLGPRALLFNASLTGLDLGSADLQFADLHRTLAMLSTLVDRIDLDVDVNHTLLPKIGLECYITPHPDDLSRWRALLAHLQAAGLCLGEKGEARP